MSRGHIFLAQNSNTDYVFQAYALASSIKRHNKINQTCLVTSDAVPDNFRDVFDYIVGIPGKDTAKNSSWKIENRWKIYQVTPFDENIVYDTDMLVLTSNDHWWDFLSNKEVVLTSKVKDYRGNTITDDHYRKVFTANNLPNAYMGVHYFKKSKKSSEFYNWLKIITENYKDFYEKFTPVNQQKFCSMDVNASLAIKFMDAEAEFLIDNEVPTFTHMKPAIQGWQNKVDSWQDAVECSFFENLIIGNILQTGVFHYTEDSFLTRDFYGRID